MRIGHRTVIDLLVHVYVHAYAPAFKLGEGRTVYSVNLHIIHILEIHIRPHNHPKECSPRSTPTYHPVAVQLVATTHDQHNESQKAVIHEKKEPVAPTLVAEQVQPASKLRRYCSPAAADI